MVGRRHDVSQLAPSFAAVCFLSHFCTHLLIRAVVSSFVRCRARTHAHTATKAPPRGDGSLGAMVSEGERGAGSGEERGGRGESVAGRGACCCSGAEHTGDGWG